MAGAVVAGGAYFSSPDLAEFNLFYYRSINSGSKGIYFTIQSTTITMIYRSGEVTSMIAVEREPSQETLYAVYSLFADVGVTGTVC